MCIIFLYLHNNFVIKNTVVVILNIQTNGFQSMCVRFYV